MDRLRVITWAYAVSMRDATARAREAVADLVLDVQHEAVLFGACLGAVAAAGLAVVLVALFGTIGAVYMCTIAIIMSIYYFVRRGAMFRQAQTRLGIVESQLEKIRVQRQRPLSKHPYR